MRPLSVGLLLAVTAFGLGCGGSTPSPSPTPVVVAPVVRSISVSPAGVGLESGTQFTLVADTDANSQATFNWQFGDGNTVAGGASAIHIYARSGTFTVQVTAMNSAGQATRSTSIRVTSLIGRWLGTITGHPGVANRWRPLTSFELRLNSSPGSGDGPSTELSASWATTHGAVRPGASSAGSSTFAKSSWGSSSSCATTETSTFAAPQTKRSV